MSPALPALAHRLARACTATALIAVSGGPPGTPDCRVDLLAAPAGAVFPDAAIGAIAPPTWSAVGLLAPARVHHPGITSADGTLAVLVDRAGDVACAVADGDDTTRTFDEPEGRIVDVCRRLLGLRTPPPAARPEELWRAVWLDRLAAAALAGELPSPLTADAVLARHPLGRRPGPPDAAIERRRAQLSWERIHRAVSTGEGVGALVDLGLDRAAAAWFDTGSFARWVLAENAPAPDAVDALGESCGSAGRALVDRVLAASGVAA